MVLSMTAVPQLYFQSVFMVVVVFCLVKAVSLHYTVLLSNSVNLFSFDVFKGASFIRLQSTMQYYFII